MFLRYTMRKKNGKEHRYYSLVENRRAASGRVVQRHALYLGEINDLRGKPPTRWPFRAVFLISRPASATCVRLVVALNINLPPSRSSAYYLLEKQRGRVAERFKVPDSKSGLGVTLTWVRIPPLPPLSR